MNVMSSVTKILYCGLLLTTLAACNRRPEGVLSRSDMRKILIDLHKTDGLVGVKKYRGEQKDECYQAILADYGISQAQFDSSIVWYSGKPKTFEKIYTEVLEALQAEDDALSQLLQRRKLQERARKPELAFLDSLSPKIRTQAPDSQRVYIDMLFGHYPKPKREAFPMRCIFQVQLQDSIFRTLQDTTQQQPPTTNTGLPGTIREQGMLPEEARAK